MNRKKKTFTPNMRLAALYLLVGALLLLAAVSGGSSIWFAPLISELLCLGLSVFFLLRLKRNHQIFSV